MQKLQEKQIPYKLYLGDDDLDVVMEFEGNTYYCEVRTNHYDGERNISYGSIPL